MKKFYRTFRQFTSIMLIVCLLATAFIGTDIYYNIGDKAYAAEFVGTSNGASGDQTIKGAQNMGTIDNSAGTTYWFAGNAFYGMVRNGVEFGEDYDASDWLLVDTDAMWGGEYLYSTWGNAYRADGSDLYTSSEDAATGGVADVNKVYYQKILTYGERLWSYYGSTWFTGKEASAVGTATVTTTNNSYRTFEDYVGGASSVGNYNYWIGAATADSIANGYNITHVKKWYETGSTDTTKYGTLNAAQAATTYTNSVTNYINSSTYNGITEDELGVQSSNIYSIIGAHLYAPSVGELEANETVYKQIIQNVYADYTAETNETGGWGPNGGWFSASKSTAKGNITAHLYDRTRTVLWSRSFSGLRMHNSSFGAWCVDVDGDLHSGNGLARSNAVAPAFNLDTSSVIMARSATASETPSSELASYNPNNLGANVEFVLQSDSLNLTTDIAGKQLNNVVAGQTYDIAYSGASLTGESGNAAASDTFYVSAAIYDENNTMLYYGKLANVDYSGAGTVSVTIPETLEAGKQYKLALFEEQAIGTYNTTTPSGKMITTYTTDYVSAMNVATFTLDSITASTNEGAALVEETTYSVNDIANLITVTSASQGELAFGTDYTIKSVTGDATVDGTNITTGDNGSKNAKELTFEIAYLDENMSVVPSTTVTFTVNSSSSVSDDTYQGDQDAETDENGFYTWEDDVSGITWKYKTNDIGNVTYLYTVEDPTPLIDAAGTLNIPSRVAGLTVIGIGGGTEDTPVVSMGDGDWTYLSIPETVTTINDYAFVKAKQQNANIVIPSTVTKIGAKAFYKSTIASVKINGMTGSIGYLAFGNCPNLSNVIIKGTNLTLLEEAFNGAGITDLTISGTVTIKNNAFKGATGITSLYLPNGVVAEKDAFNGCSGIVTLEIDMASLKNNSFPGCTSIKTLILDDNVGIVEYDWNGHTSSVDRTVYVKNGNTRFQFYGNEGTYYSAYGTSGNVRVVYDDGVDEGTELTATKNVLTAITKTLASHTNKYQDYYKGQATSVSYVFDGAKTTEQIMADDAASDVIVKADTQTGIEVSFDGTLLTTQPIDKSKVNVTALFGNIEGLNYDPEHFYVIRTEEFNSLSRNGAVTEEAVASFEPLTAQESDLKNGLSAAIVVFTTVSEDGYSSIENNGYFYATVSVRVEEYSDKDYVEETYGSYTEIVEEINGLNDNIDSMEESMKSIITNINAALGTSYDVNAEDLVSEYEKAVQALSDALSSSVTENEGNIAEVQALINSVNATYGSNITLSDNATTEEINDAITEALQVISDDQTSKNETIALLKEQYVEIAQMLSNYMSNTENMEADAVDGTTIEEIKTAITIALADLNDANQELADIDAALDNLYDALNDAMISMPSVMDGDGESAADKINSITAMINTLSASYETNNAYLRECIAEINKAFGYGYYPKYSDKYVFYINNTNSAENGLPELLFYVKTEPRTYLVTTDMLNFTEYENQELAAQTFDSTDGVKYFYLEDTVNGWNAMQSNPLNDYKKAMSALLNGFNVYTEDANTLIQTVNTICGYTEGDGKYISIPENASPNDITTAMNNALTAVDTQLNELDAKNDVFATQYAEAAAALSEFLDKDYGDSVSSEEAAEISAAARKAVAELAKIRSEMDDVNAALDNLYDALDNAFADMGLGGEAIADGEDSNDEESAADKIESISGMIAIITDNYNQLNAAYGELSGDYQAVLDYVYGEDEKLVGQVTPEQIQQQIEKNQQEAIDKAVEEALEQAGNVNGDAEALQKEIAETIDAIMDGENVTTAGMSAELVAALGEVQEMQANVTSMQATVDGYESFLTTLKNALNLDDTASTADVIVAIQGMKDQINALSEQVNTLTTQNASLTTENNELKAQIEAGAGSYDEGYAAGFAAGQSSVDTNGSYQDGYAAGYKEGQASIDTSDNSETYKRGYNAGYAAGKAENSGNASNDDANNSTEAYKNGYNEGYAAGVKSVDTSTTGPTYTSGYNAGYLKGFADGTTNSSVATDEELQKLSTQIQSLTVENTKLASQVTTLKENNADLATEVSGLTNANTALTNRVNSLSNDKASLSSQVSTLKAQVTTLTNKLEDALDKDNSDETTTDKTDDSTQNESSDEIDVESSEIEADKNSTLVTATDPKYDMGTVIETIIPDSKDSNTVAKNQKATTELNELGNSRAALTTNAASTKATTEEQLSNAYLILTYYMNHLDELGDLGSEEIKEAARDEYKNVVFDVTTSVNVEATKEQLATIEKGEDVNLTLTSKDFKDGELYFIIHESTVRANTFDVLLVTAENGSLSMELPDFSPITVTKISINETLPVIEESENTENTENPSLIVESVDKESDDSNEAFGTFMKVLIIVVFIGALLIVLYMRNTKRKAGKK